MFENKKREVKGIFTQTQTIRFYGFIVEEAIFQNYLDEFLVESNNLLISTPQPKMEIFKEQVRNIFL